MLNHGMLMTLVADSRATCYQNLLLQNLTLFCDASLKSGMAPAVQSVRMALPMAACKSVTECCSDIVITAVLVETGLHCTTLLSLSHRLCNSLMQCVTAARVRCCTTV